MQKMTGSLLEKGGGSQPLAWRERKNAQGASGLDCCEWIRSARRELYKQISRAQVQPAYTSMPHPVRQLRAPQWDGPFVHLCGSGAHAWYVSVMGARMWLQAGLDDVKKKELMAAIQSHFKDWLQQTGGMRQVYDLARMERDESSSQMMTNL